MCSDFANIVINPGNLYLIEGKVSFFMLSVASPLEVRWESMKALCLVSEICLLIFCSSAFSSSFITKVKKLYHFSDEV